MALPIIRNGSSSSTSSSERETFHKFFDSWLVEQDHHLHELISASKNNHNHNHHISESTQERSEEEETVVLRPIIDRVIQHYEHYYRAKSQWAKEDVLAMLSPSWRSNLEEAFLWIGGWRPSMAFHLLYSKSGLQLEASLAELIRGLRTGDLGDLNPSQVVRVDELQRRTIREEKDITEKMAKHQETVADSSMVELSHEVTEMLRSEEEEEEEEERVESTLAPKEEGLEDILQMADDLRLRTLKGVIGILNPIQVVHFLIAAAELHLRFHEWGKKRDARRQPHPQHQQAPGLGGLNQPR